MSTTLIVVASATPATVVGALLMLGPALRIRRQAHIEIAAADAAVAKAEELYAENERTRNLPWHYAAIEAAPEPEPAEHEGEVLHVEHATGELPAPSHIDALIAASSLGTPDAVQLRDSVNDEVARRIVERSKEFGEWLEDANAAAEEHVAEWLDVPAELAKLKQRVAETGRACCDDHGNEPCDPHAGFVLPCCGDCPDWPLFLALDPPAGADEVGLAQALSDEPEHDDEDAPADDTDRPGLWLVLLAVPVALWDRLREWWQSLWAKPEPYRGRHWVEGTQHTGTFPIVVPAQREAAE